MIALRSRSSLLSRFKTHGMAACVVTVLLTLVACRRGAPASARQTSEVSQTQEHVAAGSVLVTNISDATCVPTRQPCSAAAMRSHIAAFERVCAFYGCTQRLPRAWAMLGSTNAAEAAAHALRLCVSGASDKALFELANQAYSAKNYHLAYNIYTTLCARTSDTLVRERYYYMLIRLLPDMKHPDCVAWCDRIMRELPNHAMFALASGVAAFVCEQQGRYKEAIAYINANVDRMYRRLGTGAEPIDHLDLARNYLHLHNYAHARAHVEAGLDAMRYDERPEKQFTRRLLAELKQEILSRERETTSPQQEEIR